ncbi:MAG: nucleotidyltransferase family protein [Clostridia bacterium]|jgi:NDP-sugar pyrophosphorylase family protein|nr:nucleotidyltransferase family protein [Clostridia bacterium]MCI9291623.1 nucleotidyltransferase family protein [Clostridia bacterium]
MQAIIMAGGMGSRLRPLTNSLPKPLVKIIDKPVMEYVIENLVEGGIKDIAVTVGYKADMIMDYFGDGSQWGAKLSYFVEDVPLGTAGGVKNVKNHIIDDFVVMSADGLCNIDIKEFCNFHHSHTSKVSMAVRYMQDARGFGLVKADEEGVVKAFSEKPKFVVSGYINMGIYAFDKNIMDVIPDGKSDFSYDIFPKLLGDIRVFKPDCFWSDIGTLPEYYLTNHFVSTHPERFRVSLL